MTHEHSLGLDDEWIPDLDSFTRLEGRRLGLYNPQIGHTGRPWCGVSLGKSFCSGKGPTETSSSLILGTAEGRLISGSESCGDITTRPTECATAELAGLPAPPAQARGDGFQDSKAGALPQGEAMFRLPDVTVGLWKSLPFGCPDLSPVIKFHCGLTDAARSGRVADVFKPRKRGGHRLTPASMVAIRGNAVLTLNDRKVGDGIPLDKAARKVTLELRNIVGRCR